MRSSLRWSIVSCLQLASYSAALPTIIGDLISQEPARSVILPRAGAQAATVPTTKLTGGLYWWVTANVNGQDVKVMVDTGSSDL
jgi:predicted aspartyl protease